MKRKLTAGILSIALGVSVFLNPYVAYADEARQSENSKETSPYDKDKHEETRKEDESTQEEKQSTKEEQNTNEKETNKNVEVENVGEKETKKEEREEETKVSELEERSNINTRGIESVSVTTEEELKAQISDVGNITGDTKTITIENSIDLKDTITVPMSHGKNLVIQGRDKGITLTAASGKVHFLILDGAGNLEISHLTLKGLISGTTVDWSTINSIPAAGGIRGKLTSGTISLQDVIYTNMKDGWFDVTAKRADIDQVSFLHNYSTLGGAAIRYDTTDTPTYVTNSTFVDNSTNTSGYTGGAIHLKLGNAEFSIDSSVFEGNYIEGGGNYMQGGGAIAVIRSDRTFRVSNSVFDNNKVLDPKDTSLTRGKNADGGAIYIFTSQGKHIIETSTFTNNVAYDEGGAISFILAGNRENAVLNSTFFGNIAQGLQNIDGPDAGGAIEVNGNSTTKSYVTMDSNTFYQNDAQLKSNKGGAVSFDYADGVMKNNILVGNTAASADSSDGVSYQNLYVGRMSEPIIEDSNVLDEKVEDLYGSLPPTLVSLDSKVVGSQNTSYQRSLKVLPIKPEGLADNKSQTGLLTDELGLNRSKTPDVGAFDMQWIKYQTNLDGSIFNSLTMPEYYNGREYFDTVDLATYYTILPSQTEGFTTYAKPTEPEHWVFIGWNTKEDGSGTKYEAGSKITKEKDSDLILYGQWKEQGSLTVSYDGNTNTTGEAPADTNVYVSGADVKVLGQHTLEKEGYHFTSWNTKADGSGENYVLDSTLTITENVVLYAQWAPDMYHIMYVGNTNTGGEAPTDTKDYYINDVATLLSFNTLIKKGYTFLGWNTKADGSGTMYQPGNTLKITGDIVLYAQWKEEIVPPTETGDKKKPGSGIVIEPIKKKETIKGKVAPKTGDTSNILGIGLLLVISSTSIVIIYSLKRKKIK